LRPCPTFREPPEPGVRCARALRQTSHSSEASDIVCTSLRHLLSALCLLRCYTTKARYTVNRLQISMTENTSNICGVMHQSFPFIYTRPKSFPWLPQFRLHHPCFLCCLQFQLRRCTASISFWISFPIHNCQASRWASSATGSSDGFICKVAKQ